MNRYIKSKLEGYNTYGLYIYLLSRDLWRVSSFLHSTELPLFFLQGGNWVKFNLSCFSSNHSFGSQLNTHSPFGNLQMTFWVLKHSVFFSIISHTEISTSFCRALCCLEKPPILSKLVTLGQSLPMTDQLFFFQF